MRYNFEKFRENVTGNFQKMFIKGTGKIPHALLELLFCIVQNNNSK